MFCLFSFYHIRFFEYLRGWVKRKIFAVACDRNSLALKAFLHQSNPDPTLRERALVTNKVFVFGILTEALVYGPSCGFFGGTCTG